MTTTLTNASALARAEVAERLHLAIAHASRRLRQQAGADLTPSRAAVLARLVHDGPLTPSELAEREQIARPTITRLVAKLGEQGLVDCVPDSADRRSYRITVSVRGAALLAHRRTRQDAYLTRLLARAVGDELALLEQASELLLRLLDAPP